MDHHQQYQIVELASVAPWSIGGGALPAGEWPTMPTALQAICDRLQGVLIENRPALQVMKRYDSQDVLFYLDPPYLHGTRSGKRKMGNLSHIYANEMTDADHQQMLGFLPSLKGMAVLSGYPHPMYDAALPGWQRVECAAHADGARDRTEVLWLNPACAARLRDKGPLFENVA